MRWWCDSWAIGVLAGMVAAGALADSANLVPNGDFETAGPANGPAHWERPDGLSSRWCPGGPGAGGHAILLDTAVSVHDYERNRANPGSVVAKSPAGTYDVIAAHNGAGLWSAPLPVRRGQWYLLGVDVKAGAAQSNAALGPPMLCLRGFRVAGAAELKAVGELRFFQPVPGGEWFSDDIFGTETRPARVGDRLQFFRANLFCKVTAEQAGEWVRFARPVQIREDRFACDVVLLHLAAFWPANQYWFDNVTLRPISAEEAKRARLQEQGVRVGR